MLRYEKLSEYGNCLRGIAYLIRTSVVHELLCFITAVLSVFGRQRDTLTCVNDAKEEQ